MAVDSSPVNRATQSPTVAGVGRPTLLWSELSTLAAAESAPSPASRPARRTPPREPAWSTHRRPPPPAPTSSHIEVCRGGGGYGDTYMYRPNSATSPYREIHPLLSRDRSIWLRLRQPEDDAKQRQAELEKAEGLRRARFLRNRLREAGREALAHAKSAHERRRLREYYSDAAINKRAELMRAPAVVDALERVWVATDADGSGGIDRAEYLVMHRKLTLALDPTVTPDRARRVATEEWQRDAEGAATLDKDRIFRCWFELADLWVDSLDAGAYARFLHTIIESITITDEHTGRIEWAPDSKCLENYFERTRREAAEQQAAAADADSGFDADAVVPSDEQTKEANAERASILRVWKEEIKRDHSERARVGSAVTALKKLSTQTAGAGRGNGLGLPGSPSSPMLLPTYGRGAYGSGSLQSSPPSIAYRQAGRREPPMAASPAARMARPASAASLATRATSGSGLTSDDGARGLMPSHTQSFANVLTAFPVVMSDEARVAATIEARTPLKQPSRAKLLRAAAKASSVKKLRAAPVVAAAPRVAPEAAAPDASTDDEIASEMATEAAAPEAVAHGAAAHDAVEPRAAPPGVAAPEAAAPEAAAPRAPVVRPASPPPIGEARRGFTVGEGMAEAARRRLAVLQTLQTSPAHEYAASLQAGESGGAVLRLRERQRARAEARVEAHQRELRMSW